MSRGGLDPAWLRVLMITAGAGDLERTLACARAAAAGGVRSIQIREPGLSALALLEWAAELRRIWPRGEGALIVNDRVDVAACPDLDGVHLGWRSLAPARARALLGPAKWIGISTHREEEMRLHPEVNYRVFGPVYATPSKRGLVAPRGRARLAAAVRLSSVAVLAIGGIDGERAGEIAASGAQGLAVIRSLADPVRARAEAEAMIRAFER